MRLLVGGSADLLSELVHLSDDVRDLLEGRAEVVTEIESLVYDVGALFHVLNGLLGFLLNALNQLGNFAGGLRGFFREFTDFVCNDCEAESVLSGASCLNGRIQREQVGLFGEIVNNLDDFADVVGACTKLANDGGRRLDGNIDAV